jgi:hypothetical protein
LQHARTAQDKIYTIEAKQKMAVDEANSPVAQLEKLVQSLDGGVWRCVSDHSVNNYGVQYVDWDVGHVYIAVGGSTISGYHFNHMITDKNGYATTKRDANGNGESNLVVDVPFDPNAKPDWPTTLTGRTFSAPQPANADSSRYNDTVTISEDGRSITETIVSSSNGYSVTGTRTYTRER